MAKNLTEYVKGIGASGINTNGLVPYCVWDYSPQPINDNTACVNFRHEIFFCVPDGIRCVKFEIWGAGGHGVGACNCGMTPASASGAYAHKTMTVTPGDCYRTHVGYYYCCHKPNGGSNTTPSTACNIQCRHSWITGTGLTNFCAEHGCSATYTCCNTITGGDPVYQFQDSVNEGARYFGADGGTRGKPSFLQLLDSSVTNTDYRQYLVGVPYPGGLINKNGGHVVMHPAQSTANNCCMRRWEPLFQHMAWMQSGATSGLSKVSGWGNYGGYVCGGADLCGAPQAPGRVRITYSCCNTFEDNA